MEKREIGQDIIDGLTEFADALDAGGDLPPTYTCYRVQLDLHPQSYTPEMVKETRKVLRASQKVFASFLGVSVKTVSQWEQGLGSPPQKIACRFMDEIRRNPEHYLKILQDSIVTKPGKKEAV